MPMDDLLQAVPKLISRVDSLELDLKLTNAIMEMQRDATSKKVEELEGFSKKVGDLVLTDSEDEEPKAQGRKREEQVEDIKPKHSYSSQTLSKVASLKSRSIDKGRRYKRRKETKGKKVVSSLDFQEVDAGAEKVNTAGAEKINAAGEEYCGESIKDKEKGKLYDDVKKLKDSTKNCREEELTEQQKKRKLKLQFESQSKKEQAHDPITAENVHDELLKESRDMEDNSAEEMSILKEMRIGGKKCLTQVLNLQLIMFLHTSVDKDDSEDSDEVGEQEESVTVMNRYGMNGPEDELERVFWKYLKNMFEEPLSTDPIWSELGQQRIISWRYYESCRVHCLNLESMDVYMLIERTYPLSAEMCKAMLDKKLQGGKPDENCYKMLKMMEKQAGIRK
ncbi:hypothetical protein Tco_0751277 [Tanacetum coccineum]|uniref:Uncharacterized protein n=1 Tax=Tanacetum coccineum TaxID=301880 RepID=A0ABQ4Z667_9ASTR